MLEKQLPDSAPGNETYGALQKTVADLLTQAMTHLKPDMQAVLANALDRGAEMVVQVRALSGEVEILVDVKGTKLTLFKIRPPLDG